MSSYGQHTRSNISGGYHAKSTIRINKRVLMENFSSTNQTLPARSVIAHEIGHNFGLADNPYPSNADKNKSIMNHKRARSVIYYLRNIDKDNVRLNYNN